MLVKSAAHEKFLGEGWEDSPAKHGIVKYPPSDEQLAQMSGELETDWENMDEHEHVEHEAPVRKGRQKKQE